MTAHAQTPRSVTKRIRISPDEADAQEAAAKQAGITWSEWIRDVVNRELKSLALRHKRGYK